MPRLLPQEEIFVAELALDWNERRAALAAGYKNSGWGKRLLRKYAVQQAIQEEKEARKERLRVDADRITEEFAKVAYSNMKDYVPKQGEALELDRIDADRTAAISEMTIDDQVNAETGTLYRRTRVKLYDKVGALNSLAKSVGMLTERHIHEHSIEFIITSMSPQERIEMAQSLIEKGQALLPAYEAALARGEVQEEGIEEEDEAAGPGPEE